MLATVAHDNIEVALIGLIIVAIVAFFVWGAGRLTGRPDIGNPGAAIVAAIGALLVLLLALD